MNLLESIFDELDPAGIGEGLLGLEELVLGLCAMLVGEGRDIGDLAS